MSLGVVRAAVLVVSACLFASLPGDASADVGIFGNRRYEHLLVVGEDATPYGVTASLFYPDDDAPTYEVQPGTAFPPGLHLSGYASPTSANSSFRGVQVVGTPTEPGFHQYNVDEVSGDKRTTYLWNVIIFRDEQFVDIVAYYHNLTVTATGADTFYWAALRGYFIGIGVEDEGLAYYSYYASLGGYYYTYYATSYPQYAAYYYYYYHGLAFYYYYAYHGDATTALNAFSLYVTLAQQSL